MNTQELLEFLLDADYPTGLEVMSWHPTGSSYVCDPPVLDTDRDLVVYLAKHKWQDLVAAKDLCVAAGWELGGSVGNTDTGPFCSLKKGKWNLIVTYNQPYFAKYVLATQVAKKLNLLNKPDRIMVFQAIINSVYTNGE
jgi:hypothetical protein